MADDVTAQQSAQPLIGKDEDGFWKLIGSKLAGIKAYIVGPFVDEANGVAVVEQGQFDYETVAASQTDQVLGNTGALGDFLHALVITVNTAATAAVSIKDGAGTAIPVMPNSPGGGVGVYRVEFNIRSTGGAWSVTTGAGSTVLGIGRFTP